MNNKISANRLMSYLLQHQKNDRSVFMDARGVALSNDPLAALEQLEINARRSRSQYGRYHSIISPDLEVDKWQTQDNWMRFFEIQEEELGLSKQPRVIVRHEKRDQDGVLRVHAHAIYSRFDPSTGHVVDMEFDRKAHARARARIEIEFGHARTFQRWTLEELKALGLEKIQIEELTRLQAERLKEQELAQKKEPALEKEPVQERATPSQPMPAQQEKELKSEMDRKAKEFAENFRDIQEKQPTPPPEQRPSEEVKRQQDQREQQRQKKLDEMRREQERVNDRFQKMRENIKKDQEQDRGYGY